MTKTFKNSSKISLLTPNLEVLHVENVKEFHEISKRYWYTTYVEVLRYVGDPSVVKGTKPSIMN